MIEFENDLIRIVHVETKRGPNFPRQVGGSLAYYQIPNRQPQEVIFHHSAGGMWEGMKAVEKLASYFITPPEYALNDDGTFKTRLVRGVEKRIVIGGGRGWPGIAYPFVIPAYPEQVDGKLVVYRIWEDSWRTWHTGGVHNTVGTGVCIGGWYSSRHDLLNPHAHDRPTAEAMLCADQLTDYLMVRYRLTLGPETLRSHAELGKPACPGDFIENWVRTKRGDEAIRQLGQAAEDTRLLETPLQIQTALRELGYNPGPIDGRWGPLTSNSLRAFQEAERIRADGVFGPISRQALRQALARQAAAAPPA
jgi:hypothetical protein